MVGKLIPLFSSTPPKVACQLHPPSAQVFGVVGNPVAHSKGPLVHNAAFQLAGVDAVYVPYLVDDMRTFLADFAAPDFAGFSVTIPHKHAALEAADVKDPLAEVSTRLIIGLFNVPSSFVESDLMTCLFGYAAQGQGCLRR